MQLLPAGACAETSAPRARVARSPIRHTERPHSASPSHASAVLCLATASSRKDLRQVEANGAPQPGRSLAGTAGRPNLELLGHTEPFPAAHQPPRAANRRPNGPTHRRAAAARAGRPSACTPRPPRGHNPLRHGGHGCSLAAPGGWPPPPCAAPPGPLPPAPSWPPACRQRLPDGNCPADGPGSTSACPATPEVSNKQVRLLFIIYLMTYDSIYILFVIVTIYNYI